ncbi:MAG: M1 family aminopeptidase, partial [Ferruginibacter sp.]
LFHQWFGDLVTAESWSHITVNESFANYSETLWDEYKKGKDAGDAQNFNDMQGYLQGPGNPSKDLVRFHYADKEDVFDGVSYNKGGRVLHMLRNYVGDEAFFKSLNNYLTTNKFKAGEAGMLRLAFEEVTGKDMNWFWNQWYYGSGHPIVKIDYNYDNGKAMVIIEQTQKTGKVFNFPIAIDVYTGTAKKRYNVWVDNKVDTFTFNYTQKPDLINVDADKIMLWVKTDNKTAENYVHQIKYAPNYLDRKEALDYFAKKEMRELSTGLADKYAPLRRSTIAKLETSKIAEDAKIIEAIEKIANTDKDRKTKAAAISYLAKTSNAKYRMLYEKNITDSSYSVAGAALEGLVGLDPAKSYELAKKYSTDAKGDLGTIVNDVIIKEGTEADFDFIAKRYDDMPLSEEKLGGTASFASYLEKVKNPANVKKGIDMIIKFRNAIPEQFRSFTDPMLVGGLTKLGKAKGKEIEDYINNSLK